MIYFKLLGYFIYALVILGANNLLGITRNKLGVENYFILGIKDTSAMSDGWNLFLRVFMAVFGALYGLFFIAVQKIIEPNDSTVFLWGLTGIAFILGVRATMMLFTSIERRQVEGLGVHWFICLFTKDDKDVLSFQGYNFWIDFVLWSGIAIVLFVLGYITPAIYFVCSVFGLIVISFVRMASINRLGIEVVRKKERDGILQSLQKKVDEPSIRTAEPRRSTSDKNRTSRKNRKGGKRKTPRVSY